MSIALRFKQLREQKKFSQLAMAKLLGTSQAAVSRYEKSERTPDSALLAKLNTVLGVNIDWLLTGEGAMFNTPSLKEPGALSQMFHLPVLGKIAAGCPIEFFEDEPLQYIDVPATMLSLPPPYDVFIVEGESMYPLIFPGDYVVLSREFTDIEMNGRICAFRVSEGITLKRLVEDEAHKTIWLWPINHSYAPTPYNDETEEYHMVGILVLSIRKYDVLGG